MKGKCKKIVMLFIVGILVCMNMISINTTAVSTTVSRAEWIHNLVVAFDMTIEDGLMPDDYYTDIAESEYYNDILLAVNFGVIELEAGQEFRPDAPVTREFAVQTLNTCLGYELDEETEYTMSDYADLQYPQAAQIAINEEWLELVDGAFEPERTITITEKNNMLNFAKQILATTVIEEDHENTYEFANNIIEIAEGTPIELLSATEIMIYDTTLELSVGDSIAVYSNGIAYTYKIVELEEKAEGILITGEEIAYEDAVVSVDAEGVVDADLGNFIPAEGVTVNAEYEETAATYGLSRISGTQKVKDINLKKNVGGGTASCKFTNLKIYYRINGEGYKFSATGTAKASFTISGKKDFTLNLGYISIAGVGKVSVDMIYSADGSATLSYTYNFEQGIEKDYGSPTRKIKDFSTPTWHFSAKAELKTSCKVGFYVDVPGVANGSIYGEAGVKSEPDVEVYADGKKPTMCMDLPAYIFATVGYNLTVLNRNVASETIEIYNRNNSPVRICYHIEDGKSVAACSRPESSTRVGKRGYYSICDADSGTYSANCFVAPYADAIEPTFEYELDDDDNATITKYNGTVAYLTIPEELDGHPVVGIGANVFKGNTYLQSVVIPDGVTKIGSNAFNSCSNLSDIKLPDKLQIINNDAFGKCVSLTYIEIPNNISECNANDYASDGGPFSYCTNLKTICFQKGIKKIPSRLFYRCTGIEEIELPDSVTSIEWRAFMYCSNLKKVTIPNSVTKIGSYAFSHCASLNELTLSRGLTELWDDAFSYCDSLESVEIPKSIEEVKYHNAFHAAVGPFGYCKSLKDISFEKGITVIPNQLFSECTGIEEITIPNTVKTINSHAFYKCTNLSKVNLCEGLIAINNYAFENTIITEINIPNTVSKIDNGAFYNCGKLISIKLSKNITYLGENAFGKCILLNNVLIPKSLNQCRLTYWQEGPFGNCSSLTDVEFEEGSTKIANGLFGSCTGLKEIVIPDTVEVISSEAFARCANLEKVTLSKNLSQIDNTAFQMCENLKEIYIPNTVNTMGTYIFNGCTNLKKAHLPNISINVTEGTFQNCSSLAEINFPDTLETIETNAFKNCTSLTEVNLPEKVKTINSSAFYGCTSLSKVTIPASMRTINSSAFSHCEALTNLSIAEGTTAIGEKAFEYCIALEKVGLPDTLQTLGNYVFSYCDKLSAVSIGAGLKVIPNYCFYQDPALVKVVLPQQVTTINKYAFANCTGLTDITINRNVATIDATAFSYPDKLTIHGITGTYAETFASENSITFEALNVPATAIKLNKTKLEIGRKETAQMTAAITPEDSSDELTWTSTDETIVSIDGTGKLTANASGTTTIIAMAGDVMETCEVSVYEPVSSVSLSKTSYTGTIGETVQLTSTIRPDNATYQAVQWTSSDTEVAEVTNAGLVTLKKYGTATITVKTDDKGKTATCAITVQPIAVTGVSLDFKTRTLGIGESCQLTATITPVNASVKDVTWTSGTPAVATVEDGKVTAVSEGTSVIIVKTTDGSKTASCTITVTNSVLVSSLQLDAVTTMKVGDKQKINATLLPNNATNKTIKWSSSNNNVVMVDEYGNVSAITEGVANIIAEAMDGSEVKAQCTITVIKKQESTQQSTTSQTSSERLLSEQVKTEQTLSAVGTQVTIGNGIYRVTKSTSTKMEVAYIKPMSKNKTSIFIPDTININGVTYKVTSVASNALANNKKVTKVVVGKNITSIGKNAFSKCTKLKSVLLNSTSLKTISSNVFYGDKNLKAITIKSSKLTSKSVGSNVFKGTNKKLTIKVPKKKASEYKKFLGKKGNKNVTVKN